MKAHIRYFLSILVGSFFIATTSTSIAASYYVNDNNTAGDTYTSTIGASSNNGLTAATPKASLTEIWNTYGPSGSNILTAGDVIFVDAGTYLALDANLTLNVSGISISGAGSNLTLFDNNQTSADANRWATITGDNITITGVLLTGYNYGSGDANVVQITGANNVTLTDVLVNENLPGGGSSAIVVNGGSQVTFSGGGSSCNPGSASVAGGGVNVEGNGNDVTFMNYTFSANTKDYQGGSGLRVSGDATTTIDIDDCIFSNNTNTSAEGGGAIFIANGATMTIDGSCFNGNSSSQISSTNYGGAITVGRGSTVSINNCNFDGNSATSSGNGGALAINTSFGSTGSAGTINVTTCSFSNNSASDGADILGRVSFSRAAIFNISECTFSGTAEDVRNDNSATITISNSGTPSISGSVSFTNTTPATTTPTTNCPTSPQPCFSVLPVTFDDFWSECEGDHIRLKWTTISEVNNDYFILERATENLQFEEIARIEGAGTTTANQAYTFIDRESFRKGYYRLSQVDFDGTTTNLKTIFASTCNTDQSIYAHQFHPTTSTLQLFYEVDQTEISEIYILDAAGTIIARENVSLQPNSHVAKLSLNGALSPGVYLFTATIKSEIYQGKILALD